MAHVEASRVCETGVGWMFHMCMLYGGGWGGCSQEAVAKHMVAVSTNLKVHTHTLLVWV